MQNWSDRIKIKCLMNPRNVTDTSCCNLSDARISMLSKLQAFFLGPPPIGIVQCNGDKRRTDDFGFVRSER